MFKVYDRRDESGHFYWFELLGGNGRKLMRSKIYITRVGRDKGIKAVRKAAKSEILIEEK